jgi:hypothetical protein
LIAKKYSKKDLIIVTGALITASYRKIFSVTSRTVAGLGLLDSATSTGKALS